MCQGELTEFLAELSEFGAELREFSPLGPLETVFRSFPEYLVGEGRLEMTCGLTRVGYHKRCGGSWPEAPISCALVTWLGSQGSCTSWVH